MPDAGRPDCLSHLQRELEMPARLAAVRAPRSPSARKFCLQHLNSQLAAQTPQRAVLPDRGKDIFMETQAERELLRNRTFCFCSGTDKRNF